MQLNYFTTEYAIRIHHKIIEISGGSEGVKEYGYIDSPLNHIQNDDYYHSFEEKLTHLVFTLNKNHAFNDGNKRVSIALGTFFLVVNGLEVFADKFIIEMENIAVAVADDLIDKELLQEIIFSLINEETYNEPLKVKIINALSQVRFDNKTSLDLGPNFYIDICEY